MAAPGIEIVDAHLEYNQHLLFDHLNLTLEGGQWTCLLGPSGVGKTSLLRLIAGLKTQASSNTIKATDGLPLAGRLAYLAQNEALFPWLTALENILIGKKLRGDKIENNDLDLAKTLLQRVGLAKYANHHPEKLSGGMKQRVLLARTLFEDKPVILMDEPFAALDAITRAWIQELAAELLSGRTVLLVTHDPLEALRLGHHIYVMSGMPAAISSQIELPGNPPRDLSDSHLQVAHANLLTTLSHAKEVMEC